MYVSRVVIFIPSGSAAMILQMQERSVVDHVVHLPGPCPHAIVAAPPRRGIGRMSSSPSLGRPLGLLPTALTHTFLRADTRDRDKALAACDLAIQGLRRAGAASLRMDRAFARCTAAPLTTSTEFSGFPACGSAHRAAHEVRPRSQSEDR